MMIPMIIVSVMSLNIEMVIVKAIILNNYKTITTTIITRLKI